MWVLLGIGCELPYKLFCNGPRSILQLSDDDSTSITKLEEKKRKEEKVANASRWPLSDQMGTLSGKGVSVMGSSTGSSTGSWTESLAR